MKAKKLIALLMTLVMAIGLSLVFTACDESGTQDTDQAAVSEEEGGDGDAAEPTEDPAAVADAVNEYIELAGEYQDEWSQRASATVIADTENQCVNITVNWSGSATESAQWTMSAVKEDNKLVYSDCVKTILFYSEDMDEEGEGDEDDMGGGAEETVEYEGGSGSFEITDEGKLLWNGASEEDCQSCVFVKITE